MIDSEVFENTIAHKEVQPDIIEIMPSIAYEIITALKEKIDVPIITGGLIRTVEDVKKALNAGAIGISTSNNHVLEIYCKLKLTNLKRINNLYIIA
ncbi:Glycerol uptake operon antiterminator regulatory protein [Ureibacillus acetophenoni]